MEERFEHDDVIPWPEPDGPRPVGAAAAGREAPEATGAEQFFYRKHMQRRTPMVVVMEDGVKHRGWIEWYDREVLKLHSLTEANLFLRKADVRYMYRHKDDPDDTVPVPTPPPLPDRRRRRRRSGTRRRPAEGKE